MKQQKIVTSMMTLVVLGSSVMLVSAAFAQTPTPPQSHGNFFTSVQCDETETALSTILD